MKKIAKFMVLTLISMISYPILAQTTSASFSGTATINPTCVLNADSVNFGEVMGNGEATYIYKNSTLNVLCSKDVPFSVGFTSLDNNSIEVPPLARQLKGMNAINTDNLTYALFKDSSYTTVLANNVPNNRISSIGTGSGQSFVIYGRLVVRYVTPDSYSDTVTANITY